ncbi:hypothetical protein, partial [Escherichia coli]|uniref:hypothetical protein n=1 Tax=Escherichia coli TaxID=562 RepID=UPI0039DFAA81
VQVEGLRARERERRQAAQVHRGAGHVNEAVGDERAVVGVREARRHRESRRSRRVERRRATGLGERHRARQHDRRRARRQ